MVTGMPSPLLTCRPKYATVVSRLRFQLGYPTVGSVRLTALTKPKTSRCGCPGAAVRGRTGETEAACTEPVATGEQPITSAITAILSRCIPFGLNEELRSIVRILGETTPPRPS